MTKTITLPSGKIATIHKGVGFDLLQAQMKAKNPEEIPYALIAELVEINDNRLVYEDILQMDLEDVIVLQAEISGKFNLRKPESTPIMAAEMEQKVQVTPPHSQIAKA